MIPAPSLPNEAQRLASLQALKLLDTPIEDRFERVTRIARQLFGVSVSSFTLVDAHRQWFKSIQGDTALETPRDISFCGHVIADSEIMVVPDARQDRRFADNPFVTNGQISFYAGCPVRGPQGHNIGTLCVYDRAPRAFSTEQAQTLSDLARLIEDVLAHRSLSQAQLQLMEELDRARLAAAVNPVTRIWNPGAVREILRRELAGGSRESAGVGLVLVECLGPGLTDTADGQRLVTSRLVSCVRPEDAVGHYAAGRYLVVMTDCGGDVVRAVSHRVRRTLGQPVPGGMTATVRIGMAWCRPRGEESVEGFVLAAEDSLVQDSVIATGPGTTAAEPQPKPPAAAASGRPGSHKFPPQTVQRIEAFLASLSP